MAVVWRMMQLASIDAGGYTDFDPRASKDEQEVCQLTEREHRTAEYQTERSTNVTHQTQCGVSWLRLIVGVFQLRIEHLAHISLALHKLFLTF